MSTTLSANAVQAAVEEFAARVGERKENIGVIDPRWSELLMKGAVIKFKSGGYQGLTQATFADLGLTPEDDKQRRAWRALFKDMGKRPLLPTEIMRNFKHVRQQASDDIERYCFRLFDGTTKFVPEQAYDELKAKLVEHKTRYFKLRDDLMANLDEYQARLQGHYAVLADRLYGQLLAAGGLPRDAEGNTPDRDEWVKERVEELLRLQKSRETIEASFIFEWTVRVLPLAEDLARDQASARDVIIEQEVAREMAAARSQMQRDLLADQARTKKDELDQVWAEIRGTLRQLIYNVMLDCLTSLEGKDNLPSSNVTQLREMLNKISRMKFFPDEDIDRQMADIKVLLAGVDSSNPEASTVKKLMRGIAAEARLVLMDLDQRPQREIRKSQGPDLGVPDTREGLELIMAGRQRRQVRAVPATTTAPADGVLELDPRQVRAPRPPLNEVA